MWFLIIPFLASLVALVYVAVGTSEAPVVPTGSRVPQHTRAAARFAAGERVETLRSSNVDSVVPTAAEEQIGPEEFTDDEPDEDLDDDDSEDSEDGPGLPPAAVPDEEKSDAVLYDSLGPLPTLEDSGRWRTWATGTWAALPAPFVEHPPVPVDASRADRKWYAGVSG